MAISLQKGGNVNLSKEAPNLTKVIIGLGWDPRSTDGATFDLDGSAFLLKRRRKVRGDTDFIFYNNLKSSDGSVKSTTATTPPARAKATTNRHRRPDARAADIEKIAFASPSTKPTSRRQSFGMVGKRLHPLPERQRQREIARYDLSEDSSTETAMIFGELYRAGNDWKFRAVGQGYNGGLGPLARSFGVNV
jgi:tellurium resistance protein TerD